MKAEQDNAVSTAIEDCLAVELVGGPFCGDVLWWPVSEQSLSLIHEGTGWRYEREGSETAVCVRVSI